MEDNSLRLPHRVADTFDGKTILMRKELQKYGVKIITMGQNYLISIPSELMFPEEAPRLGWEGYPVLNKVVKYIKQFREVAITVTAYSNQCISARREHALTLARARAVANYLWTQGIDSRLLFAVGVASDKPLMKYKKGGDKSMNSRIEITFRDAIVN